MKKKIFSLFVVVLMMPVFFNTIVLAEEKSDTKTVYENVVYIGGAGYNTIENSYKDEIFHTFAIDGVPKSFKILNKDDYSLHNILFEGYVYNITVEGNIITNLAHSKATATGTIQKIEKNKIKLGDKFYAYNDESLIFKIRPEVGGAKVSKSSLLEGKNIMVYGNPAKTIYIKPSIKPYSAPVSGKPGVKTIKNFLSSALEPVGTTLYIYGGAWDWQDVGSSLQSRTIGIHPTILEFFQNNDGSFTYDNEIDITKSYYPYAMFNQYYYAGMDCSGYVGWAIYNTMNTESGKEGYVMPAGDMAKSYSEDYGFGTRTTEFKKEDFKPGDIFSMAGHVWITLGTCEDGSIVIMHSTPSDSYAGKPGGGVQISALSDKENSQAYELAQKYMNRYYKEWSKRYPAVQKSYADYTTMSKDYLGKFTWNIDKTGLSDPDGYINMSAEEILEDLFDETKILKGEDAKIKAKQLEITEEKLNLIYDLKGKAKNEKINVADWANRSDKEIKEKISKYN